MDLLKATAKVEEFRGLLTTSRQIYDGRTGQFGYLDSPNWRPTEEKLNRLRPVVASIAAGAGYDIIAERIAGSSGGMGWPYYDVQRACEELQGLFESKEELAEILGPSGPQLAAEGLHKAVWGAAAALWDDGHFRQAVDAAASAIFDHFLPAKLGIPRGSSATGLIAIAFSTDPPLPGKPRLRFREFQEPSPDWTSAHDGARFFGMGCALRIRNLITHGSTEPDEQSALEMLAALSVLARWIDEAEVETQT